MSAPSAAAAAWRASSGYVCVFCSRRPLANAGVRTNGCSTARIRHQRQARGVHSTPQKSAGQSSVAVAAHQDDGIPVDTSQFRSAVTFGQPVANQQPPSPARWKTTAVPLAPRTATTAPNKWAKKAPTPPAPPPFEVPIQTPDNIPESLQARTILSTSQPFSTLAPPTFVYPPLHSTSRLKDHAELDAHAQSSTPAMPPPAKPFSKFAEKYLLSMKDDIMAAKDRLAFCQELADDNPKHTAEEWLYYFNTHILARPEASAETQPISPTFTQSPLSPFSSPATSVPTPSVETHGSPSSVSFSRPAASTPQVSFSSTNVEGHQAAAAASKYSRLKSSTPSAVSFSRHTFSSSPSTTTVSERGEQLEPSKATVSSTKPVSTDWEQSKAPDSLLSTLQKPPVETSMPVPDFIASNEEPKTASGGNLTKMEVHESESSSQSTPPTRSIEQNAPALNPFASSQSIPSQPPEDALLSALSNIFLSGSQRSTATTPISFRQQSRTLPQNVKFVKPPSDLSGLAKWGRKIDSSVQTPEASPPAITFATQTPPPSSPSVATFGAPRVSLSPVSFTPDRSDTGKIYKSISDAGDNSPWDHSAERKAGWETRPPNPGVASWIQQDQESNQTRSSDSWDQRDQPMEERRTWVSRDQPAGGTKSWSRNAKSDEPVLSWSDSAPTRDDRQRYLKEIDPGYEPPREGYGVLYTDRGSNAAPEDSITTERQLKKDKEAMQAEEQWQQKKSMKARDKARHGREFIMGDFAAEEEDTYKETKEQRRERKRKKKEEEALLQAESIPVYLPEFISVANLAQTLKVRLEDFTQKMIDLGFTDFSADHVLDAENAGLIAMEYNYDPIVENEDDLDLVPRKMLEDKTTLPPRPPVVTIMGHVDHGKTTLLDWLRKSSVAAGESGGITQHIGAFSVNMPSGKIVTFLDTPGHEAFLSMRARGAHVTDIVILVVAADDSVMPQTKEAIKHAKAAKVPMIVAINKCDKEDADVDKVKRDLAANDVDIEDYGGDTQVICVSGKTGLGMADLEECTVLQSEILDMRADPEGPCEGWVIEATTKSRGRVATVLIRHGTLRRGDILVAGKTWTRVRTLLSENGQEVEFAGPGTPVEVDGWREQPDAGDEVIEAPSENKAKAVVEHRVVKEERKHLTADMEAINKARRLQREKEEREAFIAEQAALGIDVASEEEAKPTWIEVPFIIKADVSGSVEAVSASVLAIGNDEIRSKVVRSGVGAVTESDIDMAASTGAICLSFNVPADPHMDSVARSVGVHMIEHSIIYHLTTDVKKVMSDRLPPTITRTVTGEAEILQVFQINIKGNKYKPVAGCKVRNNVVKRNSRVRVLRGKEVVYDGTIDSLKNVKKDVTEMKKDSECGIGFKDWYDFQQGDKIQCYEEKSTPRVLE